jgi:hypothetical protein
MGIPNNMVDAISAIKDGEIGLVTTVMIGDVLVSSLRGLYAPTRLSVTKKPIEDGYDITDAAIKEPTDLYLDICLTNPDLSIEAGLQAALTGNPGSLTSTWREKKETLYSYLNEKELITVQTHEGVYESMLVAEIDPYWDVSRNWNAFFANVRIVNIVKVGTDVGGLFDAAEQAVGGL